MNFKKTAAAAVLGLALASNSAQSGNLVEPLLSPEVIEAESTNSSGFVIPLIILALLIAVIGSSGGSGGGAGGGGGLS